MKTRNDPEEVYREVLSKLGRNLKMFKQAQCLSRKLAALGGIPDVDLGGKIDQATLIAELKKLRHEWLPAIDRGSIQQCAKVSRLLDAQRRRVMPEVERLRQELRLVCSGLATMA